MPEYLAPGVYVEETSFRPKTIEGVSTSTAGFVGPTRFGPVDGEPELLTSFGDFERIYGGLDPLTFDSGERPNYLAHGVRAFFEEGGRRCYVARVASGGAFATAASDPGEESPPSGAAPVTVTARFPGRAGNLRVTFIARLSDNVLVADPISGDAVLRGVREGDTVYRTQTASPPSTEGYYDVGRSTDGALRLEGGGAPVALADLEPGDDLIQPVTVDVLVERPIVRPLRPSERYESLEFLVGFALLPSNARSLSAHFHEAPTSRQLATTVPFSVSLGASPPDDARGGDMAEALFGAEPTNGQRRELVLTGGTDGALPGVDDYEGDEDAATHRKSGFFTLEDVEDISIVAAPGYSAGYNGGDQSRIETIQALLIAHAERMKYRIAVLDSPDGMSVGGVREFRGRIDSKWAALYYPWVTVVDPVTERELDLPPSGFVAGIYARTDVERGVHKAPANEVVRLAIGFEVPVNTGQQEVLNPEGINALRFFEGRGHRVWGARTATSDGEWKYVNLRRYFAYLERSIDKGTQTFVFEPNGNRLWDNVRRTVEDFLYNEWKNGRLMGLKPEEAYFVKCDRSTMTQNDIDNGRLVCLIGVAPLRPAEFVVFRIGQKLLETR